MRGVTCAFVVLTFAAAMPQPVAAQCFGPDCGRDRSGPPAYYDERPAHHPNPATHGRTFRSAPYDQGRPSQPVPYSQPNFQHSQPNHQHAQPNFQHPQPNFRQPQPNFQHAQPNYPHAQPNYRHAQPNYRHSQPHFHQPQPNDRRPGYQAQPRPPMDYAGRPAGAAPPPRHFRQPRPDGRIEHRTQVTKVPKAARHAVRRHQPALDGRQVTHPAARGAPAPAGAGQITISVAEYRDLQNQARELQRLLSERAGAPHRRAGAPDRRSVFPDVPVPPPAGKPARL
jgi:hypothetical protein